MLAPPPKYYPKWLLRKWIDRSFASSFGHPVNWKDPKSFPEKVQWYKIYYRDPVMTRIVDKVTFKDYVREKLGDGHTARLFAKWYRPEEIDLSKLTPPYVLKSNCSSEGDNIIFVSGPVADEKALVETMRSWFDAKNRAQYGDRFAYWNVRPCVFAEEYVNEIGEGATDYKFYCFDGKVCYCFSATDRFQNGKVRPIRQAFYDADWNVLDVRGRDHAEICPLPKPRHFDEMKKLAETLSVGFPHVRVDFYDTPDAPLVGEMTFYSAGGLEPHYPGSFDLEMGETFHLPK